MKWFKKNSTFPINVKFVYEIYSPCTFFFAVQLSVLIKSESAQYSAQCMHTSTAC